MKAGIGYKLKYQIQQIQQKSIIIFDKDAEQLIGKTAKELADLQDEVTNLEFFRVP
jgi:hypothetical protein